MKTTTIAAVLVLLNVPVSTRAVEVVTTLPAWESGGQDRLGSFGEQGASGPGSHPRPATFGQTFTANGSTQILESFTFYADDSLNTDFFDFGFYVAEWDGNKAVGSLLYESSMQTTDGLRHELGARMSLVSCNTSLRSVARRSTSAVTMAPSSWRRPSVAGSNEPL